MKTKTAIIEEASVKQGAVEHLDNIKALMQDVRAAGCLTKEEANLLEDYALMGANLLVRECARERVKKQHLN